jgi:hypothetical protein
MLGTSRSRARTQRDEESRSQLCVAMQLVHVRVVAIAANSVSAKR